MAFGAQPERPVLFARQAWPVGHASNRLLPPGLGGVVAASGAIGAAGWVAGMPLLVLVGGAVLAAAALFVAPEALLALFLAAPALKSLDHLSSLPGDLTVISAALVGLTIGIAAIRRKLPPIPLAILPAALLGALVVASVTWTPVFADGLSKSLRFEFLTLLAFIAPLVLIRTRTSFLRLMVAMTAFSLLTASTAVHTDSAANSLATVGGDHIELARHTAVGALVIVLYLSWRVSITTRILLAVPALYLLRTMVEAGSRGTLVGAVLALVVFAASWSRTASGRQRAVGLLTAAGTVAAVAILGSQLAGGAAEKYRGRLFTTDTSSVLGLRSYLLDHAYALATAHPFGVGSDGFQGLTGLVYPHNIELELGAEYGIAAVLLFGIAMIAAIRAASRARAGNPLEGRVVTALFITFLFEAQWSGDININRFVWFFAGLAFASMYLDREPVVAAVPRWGSLARWGTAMVAAVGIGLLAGYLTWRSQSRPNATTSTVLVTPASGFLDPSYYALGAVPDAVARLGNTPRVATLTHRLASRDTNLGTLPVSSWYERHVQVRASPGTTLLTVEGFAASQADARAIAVAATEALGSVANAPAGRRSGIRLLRVSLDDQGQRGPSRLLWLAVFADAAGLVVFALFLLALPAPEWRPTSQLRGELA